MCISDLTAKVMRVTQNFTFECAYFTDVHYYFE